MSTNRPKRPMPINNHPTHPIPDILGQEKIDLTRLKKQAQVSQTQIPKYPRITRTLNTLSSVLKVLEEYGRSSKSQIDQLIQSVEQENHQYTRQLHEHQVAYLKLQAHTASLQSLKECYSRYAQMLDGARTMFHAYQQSHTTRDSIDQVKLGLKECTQTLCAIEAQLESMLGTFILDLQEISGFSRICPGDEYELIIRYGQQKWKTRGRILKHNKNEQNWTKHRLQLKAKLADLLFMKISEVKLLGVSLKTIGTKCFEVNDFYSIESQRMIINANQSGTIKLIFLVCWDLYDQVDTKFTFYNPNRSYSDVTRTWSMFVGNTTLLRTVNDTLSSSSAATNTQFSTKRLSTICPISDECVSSKDTSDENVHYDEIVAEDESRSSSYSSSFAGGLNSDELSSAASVECEENESIYELDILIDQVRTSLDDLRLIDRNFSQTFQNIDEQIHQLDRRIKSEIRQETEKTLEIENVLEDFDFLNTMDDEETSKTIDSGFQGFNEKNKSTNSSNINLIFIDILQRVLVLLHYIANRSKSDDNLLLKHLDDQYEQLNIAFSWQSDCDIQKILSQCDQSIRDFWTTETFFISFDDCLKEIMKIFHCTQDVGEFILNDLCCVSFRPNYIRPKSISLIQLYFLLNNKYSEREKMIEFATEQFDRLKNLSNLISKNQFDEMAFLLNHRNFNNEELFHRILSEYHFTIPDGLIGMLLPSIRRDYIVYLRSTLLTHHENPSKRLQIHKIIFNMQQIDSI